MKIEIPGFSDKPEPKKVQESKPVITMGETRWRRKGEYLTSVINRQFIKIDLKSFDIILQNGFIIKSKSVDDAKNKVTEFFK